MPLSWNEIRDRALAFSKEWADELHNFLRLAEAPARACGMSKLVLARDGFELNLEWLAK